MVKPEARPGATRERHVISRSPFGVAATERGGRTRRWTIDPAVGCGSGPARVRARVGGSRSRVGLIVADGTDAAVQSERSMAGSTDVGAALTMTSNLACVYLLRMRRSLVFACLLAACGGDD